jgi:uncharacterized protein (UPF0332 family)
MHWSEFQDSAERLARGVTEGDWRSAISRAYYAVFHFFREFLLLRGLDIGRAGQAHFNLYVGLWNCGFPIVAGIGFRVDRLRRQRTTADYDLTGLIQASDAASATRESRALVVNFQTALATLAPDQVVDGARRYLQAIGHIPGTP